MGLPTIAIVLYFAIGAVFLPGNSAWVAILLWASAMIAAYIAHLLYIPRVLGMLLVGMLLRNISWNAVTAFNPRWGVQIRAAALATIFLRCGLELDFGVRYRRSKGGTIGTCAVEYCRSPMLCLCRR